MNEMYYPYYLFQGGGQRVPNRFVRSEQRMLSNLNNNGQNAVISSGFNVERGPLGFRRKISNGPIYVIPTQLAQSMVNANGTSAAPDNSSQSAPSNANGVSQTAPSNESASNSNDYFSNMNEGQRQASYAGLSNEYNRRNAGQEKYEWDSDVTVTPKSNKNNPQIF